MPRALRRAGKVKQRLGWSSRRTPATGTSSPCRTGVPKAPRDGLIQSAAETVDQIVVAPLDPST